LPKYVFEHGWELERRRLARMEEAFDPNTVRHLEALGVPAGGRCLEVGAGAGSIARWLSHKVGPEGRVVATDVEVDFLSHLSEPNLDVRQHDIVSDELEEAEFDLVHARIVLEHIPERELCLKRLCSALAPGGLLVLEDFGWASAAAVDEGARPLFDEVLAAVLDAFRAVAGYDESWGPRMLGALRAAGLVELGADGWVPVVQTGSALSEWWLLSMAKLRPAVLARNSLSEETLDRYLEMVSAPDFAFFFLTVVTAWGRRPGLY
jgi:SAM-dependent methyltransferase